MVDWYFARDSASVQWPVATGQKPDPFAEIVAGWGHGGVVERMVVVW